MTTKWTRKNPQDYSWYDVVCYCGEELRNAETMKEVHEICEEHYKECSECKESESIQIIFHMWRRP